MIAIQKILRITVIGITVIAAVVGGRANNATAVGNVNVTTPLDPLIKEVMDSGFLKDKDKYYSATDDFLFFEGNRCTQNIVGSGLFSYGAPAANFRTAQKGAPLKNDEARSILIRKMVAGSTLVVFDSPDGVSNDDFAVIIIKKSAPGKGVCIATFQEPRNNDEHFRIIYYRKNGLDGKVSSFRSAPQQNLGVQPADLEFFEGNNCTQRRRAAYRSFNTGQFNCKQRGAGCPNDEVRSLKIWGWARNGAVVRVYDNPDGKRNDDYAEIGIVNTGNFVDSICIGSFETPSGQGIVNFNYHRKNGLDGKVSRITID